MYEANVGCKRFKRDQSKRKLDDITVGDEGTQTMALLKKPFTSFSCFWSGLIQTDANLKGYI